MPLAQVAAEVRDLGVPLLVVTGGEPLLQQEALSNLCGALPGLEIEVETNGTVVPRPALVARVARFNMSPKLENSGIRRGSGCARWRWTR